MPLTPKDRKHRWLYATIAWSVASLGFWLATLGFSFQTGLSTLQVACLTPSLLAIGIALRYATGTTGLTASEFAGAGHSVNTSPISDISSRLGQLSSINWTGVICLNTIDLSDVWLCVTLALLTELTWLVWASRSQDGTEALKESEDIVEQERARNTDSATDNTILRSAEAVQRTSETEEPTNGSQATNANANFETNEPPIEPIASDPALRQQMTSGVDEHEQPYATGICQIKFEVGQKLASECVVFSPPFAARPEFEFEWEDEEFTCQIEGLSIAGARLLIRRKHTITKGSVAITWYATINPDSEETTLLQLP